MRVVNVTGVTSDCCPAEVRAGNGMCQAAAYHCRMRIVPLLEDGEDDEEGKLLPMRSRLLMRRRSVSGG
jgi:hypothetical protein